MKKSYFLPADILLPKGDFEKWSVIACDQYTSQPDYWKETRDIVGETPSALNIILPRNTVPFWMWIITNGTYYVSM